MEIKTCPFCRKRDNGEYVIGNEHCVSFFDAYPVTEGHLLIVPKRHVSSFFDLTLEEKNDVLSLVDEAKSLLDERYSPSGYNIGVNVGKSGGQTVPHCHIHIIPRYDGDCDDPTGGVRGVIPTRQNYMKP